MTATTTRQVPVDGAELCVQSFGERADPPVLLVSGAAASMDWWDDELCARIAAGGRWVVRYDHRDTGGSTTDPPGAPSYDAGAFERDCRALVVALDVGPLHLVGLSMGGAIAQVLALRHPELVRTLTLLATSPIGGVDAALPPPTAELSAQFTDPPPDPDWTDRDAVVAWLLAGERAFAGDLALDEERVRATAGRVWDRSHDVAAAGNHWRVVSGDGADDGYDVRRITVPTLVVHGTADPLFPLPHGEALAAAIPGARLLPLDGVGHQVPPAATWDHVVPALLEHTAR